MLNRDIDIDGVVNARELGGIVTKDGRMVKKGLLIRAGRLSGLTPAGFQKLKELNVTKILDLRTPYERNEYPDPEIGFAETYRISILNEESREADDASKLVANRKVDPEAFVSQFNGQFSMGNVYMGFVTDEISKKRIADALRHFVTQPEGEAVLWHCNGGKDRTGLIASLLLSVFGADMETIEEDFVLSNIAFEDEIEADLKLARKYTSDPAILDQIREILGVSLKNLRALFEYFEEEYGSAEGFLTAGIGITQDELNSLRKKYLD